MTYSLILNLQNNFNRGRANLVPFQKGNIPWNKGIKTGIIHKGQFQKGLSPWNKGLKASDDVRVKETAEKCHKANVGHIPWNKGLKGVMPDPWNKGKKHSLETRIKVSMYQQGITDLKDWKGFVKPVNTLERRRFRETMQKLVFERDNYTCQICGEKGGDIQVDHIQSWADYVDQRFNMDNCRTICMGCHYQITFGKPMPKEIKTWGHNLGKGVDKCQELQAE